MPSKQTTTIFIITASLFHGFILLALTFLLLNSSIMHWDEMIIIQSSSIFKKVVLGIEDKPGRDQFIFVNIAYDKQLIDLYDEFGFPIGNQDITDRKKLARFFNILNKKPDNHKFVLCDIFFKDPSPDDPLLDSAFKKTKNLLIAYHKGSDGNLDLPIFDVKKGLTDYVTSEEGFLKFQLLYDDSLKTIPLLMYETLHNQTLSKKGFFHYFGNTRVLNNFILDFRIRQYDLFESDEHYNFVNLGELLFLTDKNILDIVKGRIIIIGDYVDRDIHDTIYGDMPGALILLNVYLALVKGDNIINWGFVLFLYFGYSLISVLIFYPGDFIEKWISRKFAKIKAAKFFVEVLGYMFFLGIMSVISYFMFNKHINILLLSIYLYLMDLSVSFILRKRGKVKIIK